MKRMRFNNDDVKLVFQKASEGLASIFQSTSRNVMSHVAADESIIAFDSRDTQFLVIHRKPTDTGFRVYIVASTGSGSNQPFVLSLIPDFVDGNFLSFKVCWLSPSSI